MESVPGTSWLWVLLSIASIFTVLHGENWGWSTPVIGAAFGTSAIR